MERFCRLTGVAIPEEGFEPVFKKMCLNCVSCTQNEDGACTCCNEKVMETGRKKIMAAVPDGYEIETLTLKPMTIKAPTKKCPNYSANIELVHSEIDKYFA